MTPDIEGQIGTSVPAEFEWIVGCEGYQIRGAFYSHAWCQLLLTSRRPRIPQSRPFPFLSLRVPHPLNLLGWIRLPRQINPYHRCRSLEQSKSTTPLPSFNFQKPTSTLATTSATTLSSNNTTAKFLHHLAGPEGEVDPSTSSCVEF